jgi:rod shape-determining protein MreD
MRPKVIRDFLIFLAIGILLLILQATWLYGDWINPFRLDLVFIFIVFLATQNHPGLGVILSALLGLLVDILSWGILGLSMTLYPLIFWLFYFVWVRTNIQSLIFKVFSVLLLQILYSFAIYFFLLHSSGQDFSSYQTFYNLVQSFITTLVSLPLLYLFQIFLGKRPALG